MNKRLATSSTRFKSFLWRLWSDGHALTSGSDCVVGAFRKIHLTVLTLLAELQQAAYLTKVTRSISTGMLKLETYVERLDSRSMIGTSSAISESSKSKKKYPAVFRRLLYLS